MIDVAKQHGTSTAIPPYLSVEESIHVQTFVIIYIHICEIVVWEAPEKGGCIHYRDDVESHAFIDGKI